MEREKTAKLYAFALVCALFSNVAWLAYAVTSASIPELPGLEDPALRLQELLAIQGQTLVYGWSGTIGAFLTMPYMFAMVWAVSAYGPLRWVALLIGLSGALLTAQAFLAVSVSPAYFSVPQISAQPGLISERLAALEIVQASFEAQWFLGSFLAYGVATFWIALALHSANVGPVWLGSVWRAELPASSGCAPLSPC